MVVTWVQPFPPLPAPFGPAFQIEMNSSLSNGLQNPYWWRIEVWDDTNENGPIVSDIATTSFASTQYQLSWRFNEESQSTTTIPPSRYLTQGRTTTLRAFLEQPRGIVIDADQVGIKVNWDYQQAIAFRQGATTGGGLTEDQAIQLAQVNATVVPWFFWQLAGELLPELAQALAGRLRTQPTRVECGVFDGPGNIPPPSQVGVFTKWVGIEWAVISAPPGLGIDFGAPDTTEINWGQLSRKRRTADGGETVDNTWYESRVTASQYWGLEEPSSVDIYVLPGLLVQVWCLIQLEPVAAARGPGQLSRAPDSQ